MSWQVHCGNCLKVMAAMPEGTVDAVVCDPPYGLEFMGREWDSFKPADARMRTRVDGGTNGIEKSSVTTPEAYRAGQPFQAWCEAWAREALRVLKPGGHLLAFGGSRTSHRLVCGIEDAGFEIRDTIMWLYGQGFPKSLDVSTAIDKAAGVEREVIGPKVTGDGHIQNRQNGTNDFGTFTIAQDGIDMQTAPATEDAQTWQGWGTALKPAFEPIVVARKPLDGTVAANVLRHGTGALNIDGTRVAGAVPSVPQPAFNSPTGNIYGYQTGHGRNGEMSSASRGRWPANVVLSHSSGCREVGTGEPNAAVYGTTEAPAWVCVESCAVRLLDEQTGDLPAGGSLTGNEPTEHGFTGPVFGEQGRNRQPFVAHVDAGGASRFFYCPKADTAERNAGLSVASLFSPLDAPERNAHPTVKPTDLMRWLVRLVTPPGGVVLDPFAGSGTTLCAAVLEGFDCIGIEREGDYVAICRARLAHWASGTAEMPETPT